MFVNKLSDLAQRLLKTPDKKTIEFLANTCESKLLKSIIDELSKDVIEQNQKIIDRELKKYPLWAGVTWDINYRYLEGEILGVALNKVNMNELFLQLKMNTENIQENEREKLQQLADDLKPYIERKYKATDIVAILHRAYEMKDENKVNFRKPF